MTDDSWVLSALSDDTIVARFLLQLRLSSDSPPSPSPSLPLPPSWGLRRPRSKTATTSTSLSARPDDTQKTNPRRSPTTPLSWTGCSASPSDVGCDESTSPDLLRSKVTPVDQLFQICAASDTPTTSSKRPKRKKTFAQLKEEESSLLKERIYLEKELAVLRSTLKEQRSINVNLKRIKLDLQADSGMKSDLNSEPLERNPTSLGTCEASSSTVSKQVKTEDASQHLSLSLKNTSTQEPVFVLPDLNMSPDEERDLVGMS